MLSAVSWVYGKIMDSRNSLYSSEMLKAAQLPAPTISVGNISVGGTGKTPLVAHIAKLLAETGEIVCIISRGYKRNDESKRVLVSNRSEVLTDVSEAGDEPFELARSLLGTAYVIADSDRVAAGLWAYQEYGVTAIILDDAFQHRRVARDLDIVVVDATNPFGDLSTLPTGILREPVGNLARADLIVVSRANLCPNIEELTAEIDEYAPGVPVLISLNEIAGFRTLQDFETGESDSGGAAPKAALAFCGLGNPDNFFDQLQQSHIELTGSKAFPDHHKYTLEDVTNLELAAAELGAQCLVTTAKDAVKLEASHFSLPCYVCESRLVFQDEKGLDEFLIKALQMRSVTD